MDNKEKNAEVLSVQIICVTEQKVGLGKLSSKFWEFGSRTLGVLYKSCNTLPWLSGVDSSLLLVGFAICGVLCYDHPGQLVCM